MPYGAIHEQGHAPAGDRSCCLTPARYFPTFLPANMRDSGTHNIIHRQVCCDVMEKAVHPNEMHGPYMLDSTCLLVPHAHWQHGFSAFPAWATVLPQSNPTVTTVPSFTAK